MFLKFFKDFFLKRTIKKLQTPAKASTFDEIQKVGLLIDSSQVDVSVSLYDTLKGAFPAHVKFQMVCYFDKPKEAVLVQNGLGISRRDFSIFGEIKNQQLKDFLNEDVDVLINYYDRKKAILLYITHHAKASLKVGLSQADVSDLDLSIGVSKENTSVFVAEFIKYLKVLKK